MQHKQGCKKARTVVRIRILQEKEDKREDRFARGQELAERLQVSISLIDLLD